MCLKCPFLIPPLNVLKSDEFPVDFSVLSFGNVCVCVCVHTHVCIHSVGSLCNLMDHQAPLSMEFSRQQYLSGLPFSTPGDLPDPGIKPASLASPALVGRFFSTAPARKP